MSSKSKIIIGVCSVFVIFAVVLTLYLCWPAIEGTINGSRYYTEDDVQSAYDEGYNDGITNKDELTAQIEAYKLLIEQNEITISDLNSQIEILTKQNQEYILNNEELNDTIDSLNTQIDNLGKTIADNEETISDLNNTIIELNNTIDELEEEQSSNSALITSLQEQISSLQNQIQSLNSTNSQHQASIESLNATITSLNSQISDYEDSQLSLNTQIATLQQSILDYQQQIENYLEIIEDLKEINACVVTFTVDGQVISTQQVNKTEYPTQIEDPVSEDYIFDGWMIEGTDEIIDPFTYSIIEDTNFVASIRKYKVVTFTVDDSVISTQNILNNNELEIPSPTKEHYTFLGWSLDGESIIDLSSYTITADTNFIAVFEITGVLPYTFSGNTLTGYTGTDTDITLPTSYSIVDGYFVEGSDYSVTEIGSSAFKGNTIVLSISIPNTYTIINSSAFLNCSNLVTIDLNNINEIGDSAFRGCASLNGINIPDGVLIIQESTFYGCTLLKTVTIPESVSTIEEYAFYNCLNLTELNYNAVSVDKLKSNNYVFYNAGINNIGITVNFGDSVISIPDYLFYPNKSDFSPKIVNVNLSSVTSLGQYSFAYCKEIENIVLPSSVETIGDYAFYYCTGLQNVDLDDCVNLYELSLSTFNHCTSLTNIILPSNLLTISERCFESCSSLSSISLPNTLKELGDYAFSSSGIIELVIPGNVETLGTLYNCKNLVSISFEDNDALLSLKDSIFSGCSNLQVVAFGNVCISSIGDYAFRGCSSLVNFIIPNTVSTLGDRVFESCTKLETVTIGEGVKTAGERLFYGCTSFTTLYFNAITMNDKNNSNSTSFLFTSSSPTVVIGKQVKRIPSLAFYGGSNLVNKITSVIFAENSVCESIGSYAFCNCKSLIDLILPNSIKTIETAAFRNCTSLEKLVFGTGLTTIGNTILSGCTKLSNLYYRGSELNWDNISIDNNNLGLSNLSIIYNYIDE